MFVSRSRDVNIFQRFASTCNSCILGHGDCRFESHYVGTSVSSYLMIWDRTLDGAPFRFLFASSLKTRCHVYTEIFLYDDEHRLSFVFQIGTSKMM